MSGAICKTCGGRDGRHYPSVFDKQGIGHPDHKMSESDLPPPTEMIFPRVPHHEHRFVIPVEWEYESTDDGSKFKKVTKLRCECGEETER